MKTEAHAIQSIPIEQIRVINPRCRDQKKFAQIVESIKKLGLKKPIKVSLRDRSEGQDKGYDLVYGQGRIEAFRALGHTEIPAIVVSLSKEDRLLLSLVENLARRFPSHGDLINEILRLKKGGYSNVQIGRKLDLTDSAVGDYLSLVNAHEERLLGAVLKGKLSLEAAIEISKAKTPDQQRAFLKAYESGHFNATAIRVVKRLIAHRNAGGKAGANGAKLRPQDQKTSSEEMVKLYRGQTQKMRNMVQKTKVCETKIVIVVSAFRRLLADGGFTKLLADHGLTTFPQPLAEKLKA